MRDSPLYGAAVGVIVAWVVLRPLFSSLGRVRLERWRAAASPGLRTAALHQARAGLKARLSGEAAIEPLPFAASDARFLGHPVHYVVFDGHSDGEARSVVFVHAGPATAEWQAVEECVAQGRVGWETLSMPRPVETPLGGGGRGRAR
jgi:predicted Holliday junction resolvase-like endonuclease